MSEARLLRVVPVSGNLSTLSRPKLLDQVRDVIRTRHYSDRTEEAYVGWIKRFILFHGKRHPAEMGPAEITQFLTSLAVQRPSARRRRIRHWPRCCSSTRTCWAVIRAGWTTSCVPERSEQRSHLGPRDAHAP